MSRAIILYDTTLRDGTQREGLSVSVEDKLRIAQLLSQLGVHFIEGGWPGANPKDSEFFELMKQHPLAHSQLVAFCMTRRVGLKAREDKAFAPILSAQTQWITVVGKSWDLHVTEGLRTTLAENLAMIEDTISYLRSCHRSILYDAEHWFDGYRANPDYALETLRTAVAAGAEWLVLCDTNGGMLPDEIAAVVETVKRELPTARIGIHPHNDSGVAVANAIAAVQAGAEMVQGTINGYGERCGNANLCTVIPNLQLKLHYACVPAEALQQLTHISRQVSEIVNLAPDDHAPFVGLSAFAHKGGMHVSAVQRNPITYEHIDPSAIGNVRRIVVSEQAGVSNILSKAAELGIELDRNDPACRHIVEKIKELEKVGYQFEAAEASFELLVRSVTGQRPQFFTVSSFQVHYTHGENSALATVKVRVKEAEQLTCAEGNGPVAALDLALRKALTEFYPAIGEFHLTDYKVRILNGNAGTNATTRVLIEFSNGDRRWTTVGVSANIIAASCEALVEGLEYGLLLATPAGMAT
ncbi:MAG: citramalate synthase [Pseudanabaenaceae cyanobacterium]